MARNLTGLKIREARKKCGLAQGELARRAGISASYLNLIELDKRVIAGGLVDRIAVELGVERADLDGVAERRVVTNLEEIAADPAFASGGDHPGPAEELVGRNPAWAGLVLRLYGAWRDQSQAVLALADRLNRDPFLGDSVHRMLTNVTSIRAAAEILEAEDSLPPADRRRFLSIVTADTQKLAGAAHALLDFFDSAHMRVRSATPAEHVDAFILAADNYFPELEGLVSGGRAERITSETPDAAERPETRRFRMLRDSLRNVAAEPIRAIVEGHGLLASEESRALAASALHAYATAAVLMPYEAFLEAAERWRYDLDALSRLFGVSYEQAAHRLATLRRPGAEGVRFAFMRTDASGYVTKRLPLPRLPLPRYGNACPLWAIHAAFQMPGVTARGFGELPAGEQFLFFARAVEKRPPSATTPRHLLSVMLACSAAEAGRVIYGDGIDVAAAMAPIGTICRLCPRETCGHRQEAPLIARPKQVK
jgi:predicted transcriptional regulator/transcriptional regulator with XRE-family HTH domain